LLGSKVPPAHAVDLRSALDDATDEYAEALLILGVAKKFSINVAYPEHALISLELEEV